MGVGRFTQARYAEAETYLVESTQLQPSYPLTLPVLAACCAYLGQKRAARQALAHYRSLSSSPIEAFGRWLFRDPNHRAHFMEGIARAEVSELGPDPSDD